MSEADRERETDRWIDGEVIREGGKEIDREGAGERDIKVERATEEERWRERLREMERERETERQTDRDRKRDRETDRERERQTDREGRTTVVEISRIKRLFMLIKRDNWG